MRRLLEVGSGALGDSAESAFVRANIAKRLALETEASA
jgi:hypothetical protein